MDERSAGIQGEEQEGFLDAIDQVRKEFPGPSYEIEQAGNIITVTFRGSVAISLLGAEKDSQVLSDRIKTAKATLLNGIKDELFSRETNVIK